MSVRTATSAPADALARIRAWNGRSEHWIVGLMTGTSADAVDAALVRFDGLGLDARPRLEAYAETPLEATLRREILEVAAAARVELERLMRLHAALGERYAAAVKELLGVAGRAPAAVDAIGLHGQTVRHLPRAQGQGRALSLQIGSAADLAERTGIVVVSNFRARDTAAGGEGAPLVPIVDWGLFRSPSESRVLLNLGGMANLTWLPRGGAPDQVMAFDTGPGNAVIDALMATRPESPQPFDGGGASAARGRADDALLGSLLAGAFFLQAPPRSTGREAFGEAYAADLRARGLAAGLSEDDLVATATELTSASIADALERFVGPGLPDAVYVSGGGVRNVTLMKSLERRVSPARLATTESLGIPAAGKEALAFAFLAHLTLCGVPGNVPSATGAKHPVVLGEITPGSVA